MKMTIGTAIHRWFAFPAIAWLISISACQQNSSPDSDRVVKMEVRRYQVSKIFLSGGSTVEQKNLFAAYEQAMKRSY
jgi:hypothetical protein